MYVCCLYWNSFLKFSILFHRAQPCCLVVGNTKSYAFDNTGKIFENLVTVNIQNLNSTTNVSQETHINFGDLITVDISFGKTKICLKEN